VPAKSVKILIHQSDQAVLPAGKKNPPATDVSRHEGRFLIPDGNPPFMGAWNPSSFPEEGRGGGVFF
jgi:hypothetical protein